MDIIPNILFDDRRMELYDVIVEEMKRQGIKEYKWHSPIFEGSVVHSINISQKKIVREAKERGDKTCVIFEQDIWFPAEDGWQYFLSKIPENFDVFIGGSYLIDNRIEYKEPLIKVNEWTGNHCILIHEKYYDTFLATNEDEHIDTAQRNRGDFYLCYPMAALQRAGKSANNRYEMVNYNPILTLGGIKIYGEIHNIQG